MARNAKLKSEAWLDREERRDTLEKSEEGRAAQNSLEI
jgi:hypothetical protein